MKQAILLHNPGAGDEDHLKSDLVECIENEGYTCVYFSVKKGDRWVHQLDQADFAIVAGGDGTVRGVVKELVKRNALDKKIPVTILPMGTANNLSIALGIDSNLNHSSHIKSWNNSKRQRFDVGVIKNAETTDFFLEGAGYGVFPHLIQKMIGVDKSKVKNAKDELKLALEVLHDIILSAQSEKFWIKADDQIYEGNCILLEVMNIQSIGPNLILSPEAATDDGVFNVVYVDEEQRADFADYIKKRIDQQDVTFNYKSFEAKELTIDCESAYMHIDDELVLPLKNIAVFEVRENVLEFLVPTSS
ncbi:diacylglycerol/lipid kinase family protein [Sphingobacterium faecium]